jgi:hypothetical protein
MDRSSTRSALILLAGARSLFTSDVLPSGWQEAVEATIADGFVLESRGTGVQNHGRDATAAPGTSLRRTVNVRLVSSTSN